MPRARKLKTPVTLFVIIVFLHYVTQKYRQGPWLEATKWAKFDEHQPRYTMVLGYQRTGSTYMGKLLSQDPKTFYWFEPIDSLYTSIYAIPNGWSVPSDISHYRNGSVREPPEDVIREGSRLLRSLMTCDFESLSSEVLLHNFVWKFQVKSLQSYKKCLKAVGISGESCKEKRHNRCKARFGSNDTNLEYCKLMLATSRDRAKGISVDVKPSPQFDKYLTCFQKQMQKARKCREELQRHCRNSTSRVIKTVRAPMEMAEALLQEFPNFRLLHLIRDPRAVYLSRQLDITFRSMRGKGIIEAEYYCFDVLRDIRLRKRLELLYPGRIMQVVYDDFMEDPRDRMRHIYSFLDRTIDIDAWHFVSTTDKATKSKWTSRMTFADVQRVNDACLELYKEAHIDWLGT